MSYFAIMFPELFGDADDGMERYEAYQARRNANPDNERMSRLRRGPGEDGVQRLRGHDRFGCYFVVDCNLDEQGDWQCKHEYDYDPMLKAWHTVFTNGSHYFQNPDGSQSWFRPGRNGWDRPHRNGPKTDWVNPECPCFTSVNPPPRWWVTENSIEVSEAQNDCEFEDLRDFDHFDHSVNVLGGSK
ncbi:hypothetical protein N7540_006627 [Penicillium herquei]|nr:hypothetical protein N7540_006627 [Penicillium herquei]